MGSQVIWAASAFFDGQWTLMSGRRWKLSMSHTMTNVRKWGPTKPLSCRGIRSECRRSKDTRSVWVLYGPRLGMWVTTPFSEMAAQTVMFPPSWPGTSSIYLMEAFILLHSSCQLTKLTVWLVIGCEPCFSWYYVPERLWQWSELLCRWWCTQGNYANMFCREQPLDWETTVSLDQQDIFNW